MPHGNELTSQNENNPNRLIREHVTKRPRIDALGNTSEVIFAFKFARSSLVRCTALITRKVTSRYRMLSATYRHSF